MIELIVRMSKRKARSLAKEFGVDGLELYKQHLKTFIWTAFRTTYADISMKQIKVELK